ncbi:hypothetical protein [Nocardioides sp. zg-1228]|uniref:hypothetical protein n=1 Tax=Nocardioides sp. zg-1228 TaxID=2763008 RepID=UPI001642BCC8|nr:hypothetical protein [Nocardioides sp. zg-1228]MBC2933574.1 hypothetical protein [Nocardioides sp. zg-1228]QSF56299.1 hypothetical protein JX575_11535 [Nocardioides sp. zg-1228]
MRRVTVPALAALLLAPLGAAAPAHAADEVAVSMPGGVLYDPCDSHEFSYTARLPAGYTDRWSITFELIGPDGGEVDYEYLWSEPSTGLEDFSICGSPNLAGTYVIQGTGEACNPSSSCVPISVAQTSLSFRLPETRTTIKAKPRRPGKGRMVRFAVRSEDERPTGYFGTSSATVRLQVRRKGSWRTVRKVTTDEGGRASTSVRVKSRRTKVRAVTADTAFRTGSVSRSIRVG